MACPAEIAPEPSRQNASPAAALVMNRANAASVTRRISWLRASRDIVARRFASPVAARRLPIRRPPRAA